MKILLVDDDVQFLDNLDAVLSGKEYRTVKFNDPVQALKAFEREEFDVVITDLQMPAMDGISVLKEVKKKRKNTYVFIMSGLPQVESALCAINHHAFAYFIKPLDSMRLLRTLAQIAEEITSEQKERKKLDNFKSHFSELKKSIRKLDRIAETFL